MMTKSNQGKRFMIKRAIPIFLTAVLACPPPLIVQAALADSAEQVTLAPTQSHPTPMGQGGLMTDPGTTEVAPATSAKPDITTQTWVTEAYGKLPLSFEANQGQSDAEVKFLSRGSGYTLFLTPGAAVLALRQNEEGKRQKAKGKERKSEAEPQPSASNPQLPMVLRMQLVGANPTPQVVGVDQLPGKSNYFIGNDPQQWHTDILTYARVQYQAIYPGIDLVYYGNQSQLEYDFIIAPGADPRAITLRFQGADKLSIDAQGNLILHTSGGEVIQHTPKIYQEINGVKQSIPGRYLLLETPDSRPHASAFTWPPTMPTDR